MPPITRHYAPAIESGNSTAVVDRATHPLLNALMGALDEVQYFFSSLTLKVLTINLNPYPRIG